MRRLIPLMLVVVVVAAACGDDTSSTGATTTSTTLDSGSAEGRLADARARWATSGLSSYRLATSEICFCPETNWLNTVVDGDVISHQSLDEESFFDPGPRSMETLFDEIADAIEQGYETLDVDYHPETGAVVNYYVDVDANVADEEHGVRVTSLTPYDPAVPDTPVEAAALVDDYGCGYGFAKGDAGQNLALVIYWDGGFGPDGPDLSAPITFPAEDWVATISTGADLFSNWCDDVVEPDEPTPVTLESWTLIAGSLTVTPDPAPSSCGGAAVTATLTDATAESDDGSVVDLDDIDLVNTAWGCFAG